MLYAALGRRFAWPALQRCLVWTGPHAPLSPDHVMQFDRVVNSVAEQAAGQRHDAGDAYLRRVRQAAVNVFGDSQLGRLVEDHCDSYQRARHGVATDRTAGVVPVAVIGAAGQGKSWLVRQLLRDRRLAEAIPSGNRLEEATERVIWIGQQRPADLDRGSETFLPATEDDLHPLGFPYLLVDTPGATDQREGITEISRRALESAGVLLLVVRRDQLRSSQVDALALASDGAIVLPIINAIRQRDANLECDVDALVSRIGRVAPHSTIASAVLIDDVDVVTASDAGSEPPLWEQISARLATALADGGGIQASRRARLATLDQRFRSELRALLDRQLPELMHAVSRLRDAAGALPTRIAETLVGGGPQLRALIRSRLRAALLADTAALHFPYRTLLGLLSLTSGAWDRLLLSLAGSLPSLILLSWSGIKHASADIRGALDIRDGLKRRAAAIVGDSLGPLTRRFRAELARLRRGETAAWSDPRPAGDDVAAVSAELAGIDALQEASQQIFDQQIQRASLPRNLMRLAALAGTVAFWLLMAGPIVTLYRAYLAASSQTFSGAAADLTLFPRAQLAMVLTSVLLSILPTALIAMLLLSLAQGRRRVEQAEAAITAEHRAAIQRLQRDGVLRLRWDDPLLADAEFLLSIGVESPGRSP